MMSVTWKTNKHTKLYMKIRSGFVSNSSSSSFVFVGFPKTAINDSTVDVKTEVTSKIGTREINKFALEYLKTNKEYSDFLAGNVPNEFWEALRQRYSSDFGDYDAPEGYQVHSVYEDGDSKLYWGIDVAYVSESETDEINLEDITKAQNKIKRDYPNVTPKIILGADTN
jgi:predicted SPOUT superfamily RNA methylase MTH1